MELIAAVALAAGTLVPALELIRDGIAVSEEVDRRQLLALYAVSRLEQALGAATYSWATGSTSGDYTSDGHPEIRYTAACSDDPTDGGVLGQLMDVRVTVYYDEDANDALTTGEQNCVYRTKVGKFATYDALVP